MPWKPRAAGTPTALCAGPRVPLWGRGRRTRAASTRSRRRRLLTSLGACSVGVPPGCCPAAALSGSHFLPALQRGGSKQNIAREAPRPPSLWRVAYRPVHPLPLARTGSCNPSLPCRGRKRGLPGIRKKELG